MTKTKLEGKKEIRKIKEAKKMFTNSGGKEKRKNCLTVDKERAYLHKPGLEAEPGPPAPLPSSPRECSSGSSSSPASIAPSPRQSNSGEKGGRGPLFLEGGIMGPNTGRAEAQLPPSIVASQGKNGRKEDDSNGGC